MNSVNPDRLSSFLFAAKDSSRVKGLTHNYYRYPARFSPILARAAIETFTKPGDLVLDPFVGGGTTLVEAKALTRSGIGIDKNQLAVFVSRVKTSIMEEQDLTRAIDWSKTIITYATINKVVERPWTWIEDGYQRNLNSQSTWRIRKQIEVILSELKKVPGKRLQMFLRCALLRTAQWSLDNRRNTPNTAEFRKRFVLVVNEMVGGMRELTSLVNKSPGGEEKDVSVETQIINRSAQGIEEDPRITKLPKPRLVLTSPPYPGVHVLYHRWQIQGRKETPAPYWIAGCRDGSGGSHYTFGDRRAKNLSQYFTKLKSAFQSVTAIMDENTLVVQVIAFSNPSRQLPRYLETMTQVGLAEVRIPGITSTFDGRLWRDVPSRKWYAARLGEISSSREVILIHRQQ